MRCSRWWRRSVFIRVIFQTQPLPVAGDRALMQTNYSTAGSASLPLLEFAKTGSGTTRIHGFKIEPGRFFKGRSRLLRISETKMAFTDPEIRIGKINRTCDD